MPKGKRSHTHWQALAALAARTGGWTIPHHSTPHHRNTRLPTTIEAAKTSISRTDAEIKIFLISERFPTAIATLDSLQLSRPRQRLFPKKNVDLKLFLISEHSLTTIETLHSLQLSKLRKRICSRNDAEIKLCLISERFPTTIDTLDSLQLSRPRKRFVPEITLKSKYF